MAAVEVQQLLAILQREVEAPLARVLTGFLQEELLACGVGEGRFCCCC